MKINRIISTVIFSFFFLSLFSVAEEKQENKFVGTKVCAPCHKSDKQGKQLDIWQKSKHAEAYKTLTSARADSIAKAKGSKKPAAESPECLQCHTSGAGVDAKLLEKAFDMKEGVQCETCHGAGSAYKSLSVMKDKGKATAAGLTSRKDEKEIEAFCKTCHNEKSPTYKEFKFAERWEKIKHSVPKAAK
ncbi:MAG: cytochrome c family protein [Ignavibacteriales bacterium]|nr:cytochrome c family protein [Ignavibacteriales bacterium]